ncbi:MAG: hypothetical protein JWP78_186 [Mucilaginibacter sp.]|nr:hypothetical protein [Mucilaginibacter sp.]
MVLLVRKFKKNYVAELAKLRGNVEVNTDQSGSKTKSVPYLTPERHQLNLAPMLQIQVSFAALAAMHVLMHL